MVSAALYVAATALPLYLVTLVIYRLYFHPLAKFPGPKLTAVTSFYEFYYDVFKRGKFMWQIEAMHEKYGPIVRITPQELHINDPEYYDELYGSTTKRREKYGPFVELGVSGSAFSTVSHELHRIRRGALNPFFSKKAVTDLEHLIQEKIEKLTVRFKQAMGTGEVVRADMAFNALTFDVISQYSFAKDYDHLSHPDFDLDWKESLVSSFEGLPIMRHFPWVIPIMQSIPISWLEKVNPKAAGLMEMNERSRQRIQPILDRTESESDILMGSERSIFHELRDSNLPPEEKTLQRLADEAQIIVGAGTETTAQTLAQLMFYLLNDKEALDKLRGELRTVMPTPTTVVRWVKLEHLPYLCAVISEGLRISLGVTVRIPRIATDETLVYKEWTIPFGTPVSESNYFILRNSQIFPDPTAFRPERWIKDGQYNRALDKYLVNFGRGSRQCLGMNLAYAELFLTTAAVFRRFDMELFETGLEDVIMEHDFFVPVPRSDSKGVRIRIIGELKE